MKKLKIDILGKAPSLAEIEKYNEYNKTRFRIYGRLSLFIFVVMIVSIIFWTPVPSNLFFINFIKSVFILSLFLLTVFAGAAISEAGRKESFMSSDSCIRLLELTTKYPEVSSYRDQVVAQGREFLQSEYEACAKVLEARACKELYKVGVSSTTKIDATA